MSESVSSVGSQHHTAHSSSKLTASSSELFRLGHSAVAGKPHSDPLIRCSHCLSQPVFASSDIFKQHLRSRHCKIEGGSFVCLYGSNAVCATLPLEGVSDKDYEQHVARQHLNHNPHGVGASMSGDRGGNSRPSEDKWGIFSAVQNLPSALNNPKKGMTRDFFTRTWGESFVEVRTIPPHVALPQVTLRHVEGYSRRLRKRSKLLQKLELHDQQRRQDEQQQETAGSRPWSPPPQLQADGSRSSDSSTAAIPAIFFSPNFNLEDPATFYSVFSHLAPHKPPVQGASSARPAAGAVDAEVALSSSSSSSRPTAGAVGLRPAAGVRPASPAVQLTEAKGIQEKLLQHLEAVESRMCSHIASKSSAFFQSMSHLSLHMDQLRQNQQAVTQLREGIGRLHQEAVVAPVTLLALPRRRQNILATHRILEVMSVVREVQGTIRVMLGRREFITALDLITTATHLLESDLTTIRSFRNLSGELSEQVRIIEKMVSLDFTKYVTEDLNRPLEDARPLLEEDQLIAVVFGVLRLNKMNFLDNLKEEIYAAINATVKQCVAESVSRSPTATVEDSSAAPASEGGAAAGGGAGGVGELARALPLPEWLQLLQHLTRCLHHLLRRYKAIVSVMVQAVEASAGRGQPTAEGVQAATIVNMSGCGGVGSAWCSRVVGGLQEGLCQACHFAHDRCAKLLHARSRNNGLAKMSVKEFLALSAVIEAFVTATEAVCGKKSAPFRMGLQGQCVVFVQRFHTDREGRLRANLSSERWRAVPAPRDLQALAACIDQTGRLVPAPASSDTSNVSFVVGSSSDNANGVSSDSEVVAARCSGDSDHRTNSDEALSDGLAGLAVSANSHSENDNNSDGGSTAVMSNGGGKQSQRSEHRLASSNSSNSSNCNVLHSDGGSSIISSSNDSRTENGKSTNTTTTMAHSNKQQQHSSSNKPPAASLLSTAPSMMNMQHSNAFTSSAANFHLSQSAPNLGDAAALGDAAGDNEDGIGGGCVSLGGQQYVVVGVGVVVVRLMVEYAECASTLQMAAQSLLAGLADLLRRFNSDTCRLLLEAGAVSLGGLRTISTRHLALAHRCLHLLLALLPPLHTHYAALIKPAIVEKTISQLSREFSEHCLALEAKIIVVVGDQLDRLLGGWEARSPVPSQAMTGILKALTRLHEAITGVLTQDQVCSLFSRLTSSLRDKLRTHLARLNVMPVGPQSWVVTSELTFYFNHLASLKVDPRCTQEQFSKQLWAADSPATAAANS